MKIFLLLYRSKWGGGYQRLNPKRRDWVSSHSLIGITGTFPYAKPGDLRKAMQGARIRTSAVRDIRWISRQVVQLLVDADYVSAFTRIITSLDATIVKSFKAWVPRSEASGQG
ncbi:hypothetical protein BASA83_009020 [Batrachochytrium salamandrivorans]|nr:hypothetical protein BASA83_009020 [Batrachochytrium salamandrivorans]